MSQSFRIEVSGEFSNQLAFICEGDRYAFIVNGSPTCIEDCFPGLLPIKQEKVMTFTNRSLLGLLISENESIDNYCGSTFPLNILELLCTECLSVDTFKAFFHVCQVLYPTELQITVCNAETNEIQRIGGLNCELPSTTLWSLRILAEVFGVPRLLHSTTQQLLRRILMSKATSVVESTTMKKNSFRTLFTHIQPELTEEQVNAIRDRLEMHFLQYGPSMQPIINKDTPSKQSTPSSIPSGSFSAPSGGPTSEQSRIHPSTPWHKELPQPATPTASLSYTIDKLLTPFVQQQQQQREHHHAVPPQIAQSTVTQQYNTATASTTITLTSPHPSIEPTYQSASQPRTVTPVHHRRRPFNREAMFDADESDEVRESNPRLRSPKPTLQPVQRNIAMGVGIDGAAYSIPMQASTRNGYQQKHQQQPLHHEQNYHHGGGEIPSMSQQQQQQNQQQKHQQPLQHRHVSPSTTASSSSSSSRPATDQYHSTAPPYSGPYNELEPQAHQSSYQRDSTSPSLHLSQTRSQTISAGRDQSPAVTSTSRSTTPRSVTPTNSRNIAFGHSSSKNQQQTPARSRSNNTPSRTRKQPSPEVVTVERPHTTEEQLKLSRMVAQERLRAVRRQEDLQLAREKAERDQQANALRRLELQAEIARYDASVAGKSKQTTITPRSHSPSAGTVRYDTTVGSARNSFNITTVGRSRRAEADHTTSPPVAVREAAIKTPPSNGLTPLKSILRTSSSNTLTHDAGNSNSRSGGKSVDRRASSVPPQRPAQHQHSNTDISEHNNSSSNSGALRSSGLGASLLASRQHQQQQHQHQQLQLQSERMRSATPPGRSTQSSSDRETRAPLDFAKEARLRATQRIKEKRREDEIKAQQTKAAKEKTRQDLFAKRDEKIAKFVERQNHSPKSDFIMSSSPYVVGYHSPTRNITGNNAGVNHNIIPTTPIVTPAHDTRRIDYSLYSPEALSAVGLSLADLQLLPPPPPPPPVDKYNRAAGGTGANSGGANGVGHHDTGAYHDQRRQRNSRQKAPPAVKSSSSDNVDNISFSSSRGSGSNAHRPTHYRYDNLMKDDDDDNYYNDTATPYNQHNLQYQQDYQQGEEDRLVQQVRHNNNYNRQSTNNAVNISTTSTLTISTDENSTFGSPNDSRLNTHGSAASNNSSNNFNNNDSNNGNNQNSVNNQSDLFTIRILRAYDLRECLPSTNAYVTCDWGAKQYGIAKTHSVINTTTPEFNASLKFKTPFHKDNADSVLPVSDFPSPYALGVTNDLPPVRLVVHNKNPSVSDEVLGYGELNIYDIIYSNYVTGNIDYKNTVHTVSLIDPLNGNEYAGSVQLCVDY